MIKARYERVALDSIGYIGGWGEVKINPTRDETREFIDEYNKLDAKSDDTPEFIAAASKVLGKCHIADGEDFDLSDVKVLEDIDGGKGDPDLVVLLVSEFMTMRNERIDKTIEPFRRLRMVKPKRTDGQPEVASITYTGG